MKKSLRIAALPFLTASLLCTPSLVFGAGAKPAIKPNAAKPTQLPAGGKVVGDVYSNSEFKLELAIPKNFVLNPSTAEDDKRGAELLAGGNEERKRAIEAASAGTTTLIDVTLQKAGLYRNASLMAEDISAAPLVESGKDYVTHVTVQLRASKMKFSTIEGSDYNLDGRSFSTKALEMQLEGHKIYQAYTATVLGRRALVLILTAESLPALRELMATFKPHFLEPPPAALENASLKTGAGQTDAAYVKNGVYTNPLFKMNFRVPEGWSLREGAREAVRQKASGEIKNAPAQPGKNGRPAMDILFIATPPESTNSVMMMAIGLNGSQISPTLAIESMVAAGQKKGFQPVSKVEEKKISGQRFSRSVLKGLAGGLDVYQAYNATVLRDYVLCFVVTANDTEQLDNLQKISVKNLDFN